MMKVYIIVNERFGIYGGKENKINLGKTGDDIFKELSAMILRKI